MAGSSWGGSGFVLFFFLFSFLFHRLERVPSHFQLRFLKRRKFGDQHFQHSQHFCWYTGVFLLCVYLLNNIFTSGSHYFLFKLLFCAFAFVIDSNFNRKFGDYYYYHFFRWRNPFYGNTRVYVIKLCVIQACCYVSKIYSCILSINHCTTITYFCVDIDTIFFLFVVSKTCFFV